MCVRVRTCVRSYVRVRARVCVCVIERERESVCVCVCVYARMYVADGWAGIAYTVIANTCVVTEADN